VCCDPRLVKALPAKKKDSGSAKLIDLMQMVDDLLEEGRKILVFSQFTSMLALIEEELRARQIAYALLTGETRDRTGQVAAFQRGDVPLFLISLKAGGVGLNLTAAEYCFILDPWWNPAAQDQAADRAHRIGQDRTVMIHPIVALDSVEEKILELQAVKRALAAAAVGEGAVIPSLTRDDLLHLLA
ncbi:MAG: SWF/SNF helicase family protein, partial [Pseudobdellovibrionaceae bacterium]|nr:SWF/SNF helicase family protein [Pseudobdellovibrionaceae bacterium]